MNKRNGLIHNITNENYCFLFLIMENILYSIDLINALLKVRNYFQKEFLPGVSTP